MNNTKDECFKLYQQAKLNLESNEPSFEDEFVVAMWEQAQEDRKTIVDQTRKIDLLETKVAQLDGTLTSTLSSTIPNFAVPPVERMQ